MYTPDPSKACDGHLFKKKQRLAFVFLESSNAKEKLEAKIAWECRSSLGKARLDLPFQTLGEEN